MKPGWAASMSPKLDNDKQDRPSRRTGRPVICFILIVSFFAHFEAAILSGPISKPISNYATSKQTTAWRRAILLSTGFQLKICPSDTPELLGQQTNLVCHNIQLNHLDKVVDQRNGTNPKQITTNGGSSASILPANKSDTFFERSFNGQLESDRRWIVDLDYLYAPKSVAICRNKTSVIHQDCQASLILFWIDKNNKTLHHGSFKQDETRFWVDETSPPINLTEQVNSLMNRTLTQTQVQPVAIVLDRLRSIIHVIISKGGDSNLILSGQIHRLSGEINLNRIATFNGCQSDRRQTENYAFDQVSNLLFYTDKRTARIFALDLKTKFIGKKLAKLDRLLGLDEATVIDQSDRDININGLAIDQDNAKLFWIDSINNLMSSSLSGNFVHHQQILSAKPQIRSSHSMRISNGVLLLSDHVKKSLVALKLDNQFKIGQPTHRVLFVGSPSVLGFRLVDQSETTGLPNGQQRLVSKLGRDEVTITKSDDVSEGIIDELKEAIYDLFPSHRTAEIKQLFGIMKPDQSNCDNPRSFSVTKLANLSDSSTRRLDGDHDHGHTHLRGFDLFMIELGLAQIIISFYLIYSFLKRRSLIREQQNQQHLNLDTKAQWMDKCGV